MPPEACPSWRRRGHVASHTRERGNVHSPRRKDTDRMMGNWSRLEIAGKPADVYEPPGPGRPRFAVLHLHGASLETLHDKPAFTRLFRELNRACVCPHGQRCWWGDRLCAEFDEQVTPERH